ncbi:MAG: Ig-like domain-containing protein [Bradymonadaceae bacterium]
MYDRPLIRIIGILLATVVSTAGCGDRLVGFDKSRDGGDTLADTSTATTDAGPDTMDATRDTMDTDEPDAADVGDQAPPTVSSTTPTEGETGVATDVTIEVTFSEAVESSTVTPSSLTLSTGGNSVSASVTASGKTATLDPDADLDAGTLYTAEVTTDVEDAAGNALARSYTWSFRTEEADKPGPFQVVATNPRHLAPRAPLRPQVTAEFSAPIDPASVTSSSFKVTKMAGPISGQITINGSTVRFFPDSKLALDTDYTVTLSTQIASTDGRTLQQQYAWSFTTTDDPGQLKVVRHRPLALETNFAPDGRIWINFNKPVEPGSVDSSTVKVTKLPDTPQNNVTGDIRLRQNNRRILFLPNKQLETNTPYRVTIFRSNDTGNGVEDSSGGKLAADYVWTFTTGTTIKPALVRTRPADSETSAPLNTNIVLRFSKRMNHNTIDSNSVTVTPQGGSAISGTVTRVNDVAARFNPDNNLQADTVYNVVVTRDIEDVQGNRLIAESTFDFKTVQSQ